MTARSAPMGVGDLVVVDVEGNGQQSPEIIEIAVLRVGGTTNDATTSETAAEDLQSWLVRPRLPILPLLTRTVHGISNADVAASPRWSDVAGEIHDALGDRVLVAHNAAVEYRILSRQLPGWAPPMVLDTLRLAKRVWPDLASYKLSHLADHAQLDPGPLPPGQRPHRAEYDARCTWALLCALTTDSGMSWAEIAHIAALPGIGDRVTEDGLW